MTMQGCFTSQQGDPIYSMYRLSYVPSQLWIHKFGIIPFIKGNQLTYLSKTLYMDMLEYKLKQ